MQQPDAGARAGGTGNGRPLWEGWKPRTARAEEVAMADMLLRRRDFLHHAAVGAAGLAGILAYYQAPAYAQKRRLTMLIGEHFVPVSDENLRKWMAEFAKLHGIDGKIDSIAHRDTYVRLATEAETKTGHDIVFLFFNNPQLYAENL